MMKEHLVRIVTTGLVAAACTACGGPGQSSEDTDTTARALEAPTSAVLPSGALQAKVVEIGSNAELLYTVNSTDAAYIHTKDKGVWYFKTGPYLLGVESFIQFDRELDGWVDLGKGSKVAPRQARVVGHDDRAQGWVIPSLENGGSWPARIDSVWIVGTDDGILGMGGAPQGIPLGTEVFGSMQTYGGDVSTPYLIADDSPGHDSARIRGLFPFGKSTLLGGHSAGSSAARRLAIDVGLTHVWLYGTPNYSRKSGEYTQHEKNGMAAQIINNNDDPVTNCLWFPIHLVSLAWGTAKCHNYSGWDYERTSPEQAVCN